MDFLVYLEDFRGKKLVASLNHYILCKKLVEQSREQAKY